MKPNGSFDNGVQVVWDNTSIELFMTCPRKYYWRMIANVVPARKSVHLLFGGWYATALEHFYKYRAEGASIEEAQRRVVREALIATWDERTGAPFAFADPKYPAKTRENLIRTIIWYIEEFGDESEAAITTHHLKSGKPAVELSFQLEFTDDIILAGHLDRVVSYHDDLYWMDQKTTGSTIGPYFFDDFQLSNQATQYTWAGQALFQSPVKGGIIDGVQIAVGFSRYLRGFTHRTKGQLQEWATSILDVIKSAQAANERGRYPMNTTACGNYGGCPYKGLCSKDPSIRDKFIDGDYTTASPWDPSKER